MSKIGNAVAERQNTLANLIDRQKGEIARALPRHMSPDRLARIATTVMRQTPRLGEANPASFLGALMTCAQLGLEPGPLGHAYLVPFKNHKRGCRDRRSCDCVVEVTFIPGYRGLVDLARRSGQVSNVQARVVREADVFDYEFGLEPKLTHRPQGSTSDVSYAYAVLKLKDGAADFDVMDLPEIAAIRKRSKASDDGPWATDFAEMAKKTVLRRLMKTAPMSVEYQQAVANDEAVRTSVAAEALDLSVPYESEETVEGEVVADWPDTARPPDADPAGDPPPDPAEG
jgi:recombination protein RecT